MLKKPPSKQTGGAVLSNPGYKYLFLGDEQMPWGLAASDESASVKWYRSTAPNEEGLPSQLGDLPNRIWDAFEPDHSDDLKVAWADCWADGLDRSVICRAKRNKLMCKLNFYRVPEQTRIVTFSRWAPGDTLTEKQLQVCHLSCDGLDSDEIAKTMGISRGTVNEHKQNAMEKLGAKTPEQLGSFFTVAK